MVVHKKIKKLLIGAVCAASILSLGGCGNASNKQISVGISQIAEHPALDSAREGFIAGLKSKGFVENENIVFDIQNAQGDIANSQMIAQNFVSQKKDMIFAIGTPSAQSAMNATSDIPILFTAVTDPLKAGLVKSIEKSGNNVAGTSDAVPIDNQLSLMKKLLPNVTKIGILYNTSEINSEVQIEQVKTLAPKHGLEVIVAGVSSTNEISQTLQSILGKVDVMYALTDNIIASAMPLITTNAAEKGIAVIGAEEAHVQSGALATEGINYYDLGFQTGEMAAEVLSGKDIKEMPVATLTDMELVINEEIVQNLGVELTDDIKDRAKMIQGVK